MISFNMLYSLKLQDHYEKIQKTGFTRPPRQLDLAALTARTEADQDYAAIGSLL